MNSSFFTPKNIMAQLILTLLAILFIMPLIIMVKISLTGDGIGNYLAVLRIPMITRLLLNSAIIAVCTIIIVFIVTILAAYAFSKLGLKGSRAIFNGILVGLMIPGVSLTVPLFLMIKNLHMFNTYWAVVLPMSAGLLPFTTLLVRNFLDEISNELLESARMDGCNSFMSMVYVIIPLSKPISAVVIVWSFLQSWNQYFMPLLFMQDPKMMVVTQAPSLFQTQYSVDIGKVFASLVLISLPVIVLYLFTQKYFEKGMTAGSIK